MEPDGDALGPPLFATELQATLQCIPNVLPEPTHALANDLDIRVATPPTLFDSSAGPPGQARIGGGKLAPLSGARRGEALVGLNHDTAVLHGRELLALRLIQHTATRGEGETGVANILIEPANNSLEVALGAPGNIGISTNVLDLTQAEGLSCPLL